MEAARSSVPLWFFGAAGSGGVARAVIPSLIDNWKEVQQLSSGPPPNNSAGPTIGIGPAWGYPQDVTVADIQDILDTPLTIVQIVQQNPMENNMFSKNGYMTLDAWMQHYANKNQLAARVVFDAFGKSLTVEPEIAQAKLDQFRADISNIKSSIIQGKIVVASALFALLFLLGLADVATATDAFRGYFPDWPGGQDFPWSMFTQEGGSPLTIPQYWVGELPPQEIRLSK